MNRSFIYWLRWIAVLPGALIAALLITFPLHWMLYIGFAHDGTLFGFIELPDGANIFIERTISPLFVALTTIVAGYKIAPQYKFKVSILLSMLYATLMVGSIVFMPHQFHLELRGVLAFVGLAIGLYWTWKQSSYFQKVYSIDELPTYDATKEHDDDFSEDLALKALDRAFEKKKKRDLSNTTYEVDEEKILMPPFSSTNSESKHYKS